MNKYDNTNAFRENEIEANKYTARCMSVMAIVVAVVWILNILGIFIVPQKIMAIAAVGSIIFLMIPAFVCSKLTRYSEKTKVFNMACCIIAITLIASAMPKHGIVAWAAPVALSCHYYSKRFTLWTYIASVALMAVSLPASAYFGEWDVSIFGNGAIEGMRNVDGAIFKRLFVFMLLPRAMTLAGIASVCITLSNRTHMLLEKQISDSMEKQRIASELDIATEIQTSMLPCSFPAFPERLDFKIFASMHTAKEVGGDFYDFFLVGQDKLAFLIADVSGKGIPAAMFMMSAKSLIKGYAEAGRSAEETFTLANKKLCEGNDAMMFVTAWLGIIDLNTGVLDYANAGHNPPLIKRADGDFEYIKSRAGLVLAGMDGLNYRKNTLELSRGDRIFLYTDGVTEATDLSDTLFGEDRLLSSLNGHKELSADDICHAVKDDVDAFVGDAPQFDDITMLCFDYIG